MADTETDFAELEEKIEQRAAMLMDRYGYSEEFAWVKAQDDLAPQEADCG